MIIRMKRDYFASYKYHPLLKGNNYDVSTLPKEVQEKVPGLLKSSYAIEVEEAKTAYIMENYRSIQLEEKQKEEQKEEVERFEREEKARESLKPETTAIVPKRRTRRVAKDE